MLSISDLPALPENLARTLRVANDPEATLAELEEVVTQDQSLVARVLQVANSAFYGARGIGTIRRAIQLQGVREIQNIAASMALAPQFESDDTSLLDGPQLWRHALAVAMWTEVVARRLKFLRTETLYTAGLMHDIGLLVLAKAGRDALEAALQLVKDGSHELVNAEESVLATNHARVGAMVCAKWMLPAELTKLISIHHSNKATLEPTGRILQLAEYLAEQTGMGEFMWREARPVPTQLLESSGLKEEDLHELMDRQEAVCGKVDAILSAG